MLYSYLPETTSMFSTSLVVDINTMNKLSLERFKRVKPNVWTCRCPVCGDSKKRKFVTRFYFYVRKGQLNTRCHNCGYSRSFFNFMKDHQSWMFNEYKRETLLQTLKPRSTSENIKTIVESSQDEIEIEIEIQSQPDIMRYAPLVKVCADLESDHLARVYLENRGFSESQLSQLWYAPDFYLVASSVDPGLEDKNPMMHRPRIIIPFLSDDGYQVEMIQGRSLDAQDKMRYISVKSDPDVEKVYGKHSIDYSKPVCVVEGPFDSMFVDNCLAVCDANLTRVEADVYIWDNQPRNPEVISYMEKAISEKRKVVIWPNSPDKKQDINDLILSGVTPQLLNQIIKIRTFTGIKAIMELNKWRRI